MSLVFEVSLSRQPLHRLNAAEQTAALLREGIRVGRWSHSLPGELLLSAELDISPQTLRNALRELESEGLLVAHGRGRRRTIVKSSAPPHQLRVGILIHETPLKTSTPDALVQQIPHYLESAGHLTFFACKSQIDLQHDVTRIAEMTAKSPADAWIVDCGSPAILEWFSRQATPCLALYGRSDGLQIARAGPDKETAYQAATRRLIELGHRRIVLIALGARRKPTPGIAERAFLNEMTAHNIPTGDYNLPDWQETPAGLNTLLESLFHTTPPTALIIDEQERLLATMQFLLRHGIKVPKEVSLVSSDNGSLVWCHKGFAHMSWDNTQILRRVVRWVAAVKRGHPDRKTINTPTQFIPGGSIGPALQSYLQTTIRAAAHSSTPSGRPTMATS